MKKEVIRIPAIRPSMSSNTQRKEGGGGGEGGLNA